MENLNKEKQIEDMAKVIASVPPIEFPIGSRMQGKHIYTVTKIAEHIYNTGCRKQSENTIELPYKVGRTVYVLRSQTSNGKNLYLREERIDHYRIFSERSFMCFESGRLSVPDYLWETSVFLTQEEAEAKMKGGAE